MNIQHVGLVAGVRYNMDPLENRPGGPYLIIEFDPL